MDNTILNQTQTEQMPNGMGNNMSPGQPEHHKSGKGIFIAILVVVVAILLGYWYLNAPKKVPEVENTPVQNSAAQTTDANDEITAAEAGLDDVYFEGVSSGL